MPLSRLKPNLDATISTNTRSRRCEISQSELLETRQSKDKAFRVQCEISVNYTEMTLGQLLAQKRVLVIEGAFWLAAQLTV